MKGLPSPRGQAPAWQLLLWSVLLLISIETEASSQVAYLQCEEGYTGNLLSGFINYGQALDANVTIITNPWIPPASNPNAINPIAGVHNVLIWSPAANGGNGQYILPQFYFVVNQDGTIAGHPPTGTITDAKGAKSYSTVIGTATFTGNNFPFSADSESASFSPVTSQVQFWMDPPTPGPPPPERVRTLTFISDFFYTLWARWTWFLNWAEGPYVPGASGFSPIQLPIKFVLQAMPTPNQPPCTGNNGGRGKGAGGGVACTSCGGSSTSTGLATASLSRFDAGVVITDTPITYTPGVGAPMNFTVNYQQRYNGPSTFTYSNLGPQWNMGWVSYITGGPTDNQSQAVFTAAGGDQYTYDGYEQTVVQGNLSTVIPEGDFQSNQGFSHATLHYRQSPQRYELWQPDGSIQVFGQPINTTSGQQFFLTSITDPQGNVIKLSYDIAEANQGYAKLTSVTDSTGGELLFSYDNIDPLKITKVSRSCDGLSAKFGYTNGQLTSITDPEGLTSSYHYQVATNFIESMITPYGTTTFNSTDGNGFYEADMTNPLGQTERVEYQSNLDTSLYPASETSVPSGSGLSIDNANLNQNNTFYWTRRAMADAAAGGVTIDSAGFYSMAQATHWAKSTAGTIPVALSTKMPLEGRVWYNYPGQNGDFLDPLAAGTSTSPSATARLLDDGTTQLSYAAYNANGLITQKIDPVGRITNFNYDTNGIDLLTVTQADGSGQDTLATMSYNSEHEPLTSTDASGQTTTLTYNGVGQVLTSTDPKGETTTMTYYSSGFLNTMTAPMSGATTTYTYDSAGRVHTVTDSEGYTLTGNYDNLDRLVSVEYPDGTSDQVVYRNLDIWKTIDRQGRTTWNQYDPIREMLQTTDAQGRTTKYRWCTCGGLSAQTDADGNLTTWNLDMQGRVTGKVYADGTRLSYAYTSNLSLLHSITDARGDLTVYTYNPDNNLASASYTPVSGVASTPNVSFTYDSAYNRLTSINDGNGMTTYIYNPITGSTTTGAGRLANVSIPIPGTGDMATVAYSYDQLGQVTGRAIDSESTVTTTFDSLGRATNVTNPLGAFTYAYADTTNRLSSIVYPVGTGLSTSFSYYGNTGDQRLQNITNSNNGAVLSKFDYTYNSCGTIATWQQQTDSNAATTYTLGYDNADQLISAVQTSTNTPVTTIASDAYNYDPAGNCLAETTLSGTTASQFNKLNQLTGLTAGAGTQAVAGYTTGTATNVTINALPTTLSNGTNFTLNIPLGPGTNAVSIVAKPPHGAPTTQLYQIVKSGMPTSQLAYDADGNTLIDENGNHYQWDALNRLTKITYPSGASTFFAYDGLSRRTQIVEENSSGTVTSTQNYLWIGSELAEERDASNNVMKRFFPQGEQQINSGSTTSYYYTRDHLNSIRELTDSSGTLVARYGYDMYGGTTLTQGSNIATFGFTGDLYHSASGLYLTKFRAYNSNRGRWLSRDPILERGGKNLYEYCQDDATSLIDQLGLSTTTMTITVTPGAPFTNPNVDITVHSDCCKNIEFIQYVNSRYLFAPFGTTQLDNSDSTNSFYPKTGTGDGFASMNDSPGPGAEGGGWFTNLRSRTKASLLGALIQEFVTCAICQDPGPNFNKILACIHWRLGNDGIYSGGTAENYPPPK